MESKQCTKARNICSPSDSIYNVLKTFFLRKWNYGNKTEPIRFKKEEI